MMGMILMANAHLKVMKNERREQSEKVKEFHPSDNLEIPNWKDLTKNPNNKANLT